MDAGGGAVALGYGNGEFSAWIFGPLSDGMVIPFFRGALEKAFRAVIADELNARQFGARRVQRHDEGTGAGGAGVFVRLNGVFDVLLEAPKAREGRQALFGEVGV